MNIDYLLQDWKYWMLELLSISCLSVAIKFNEKSALSMHEIQVIDCHIASIILCFDRKRKAFQYTKLKLISGYLLVFAFCYSSFDGENSDS